MTVYRTEVVKNSMAFPVVQIIRELSRRGGRKISAKKILFSVGLKNDDFGVLNRFLDQLVAAELLYYGTSSDAGFYQLRQPLSMVTGVVHIRSGGRSKGRSSARSAGYGFVTNDDESVAHGDDIYVPQFRLANAMDGDTVTVVLLPQQRTRGRRRVEGVVVDVAQRAHKTVLGQCRLDATGECLLVRDDTSGLSFVVDPTLGDMGDTTLVDQVVVLEVTRYPTQQLSGLGSVVKVLGAVDQPQVDILIAAYRQGIATEFSAEVLSEAQRIAVPVAANDYGQRINLCELPLITIDGADARDFDDAVALQRSENEWKLWIAIADVSHYVQSDSLLDIAARERSSSVYFPGSCIPMLPEVLSNGICSLNPDVERLVLALELRFDDQGNRVGFKVFSAVMRSHARLTYEQVQDVLDRGANNRIAHGAEDSSVVEISEKLLPMLVQMAQFAKVLRKSRAQRGALDFDLPETDIVLDEDGLPANVGRRQRLESHRLIEEFMLAANESVADFVLQQRNLALFRIHESPSVQTLHTFQQFLATLDLGFNIDEDGVTAAELNKLLKTVRDTPHEYIVNQILLRTMQQARYSAENLGHFALASAAYCHFTSPIRRYPDLMQHRIVLKLLAGDNCWQSDSLDGIAQHATDNERRAMLAERDIVDLRKCQFMLDKVGGRYSGLITNVTAFGFFVTLTEFFVEGLVHIRTLADDYYQYEAEQYRLVGQRMRHIFQVGMAVTVEVSQVRTESREIDFVLPGLIELERRKPTVGRGKKSRRSRGEKSYHRS